MGAPEKTPDRVRGMFDRISRRYEFMNFIMTWGRIGSWRRMIVSAACQAPAGALLDVGAGAGGISLLAAREHPGWTVTGLDFSEGMLRQAANRERLFRERARLSGKRMGEIRWTAGDAMNLPFPDNTFDAVTSAYLVRNVPDAGRALREQARVLKPGGTLVCFETSPPPNNLISALSAFYLSRVIPALGQLLAGDREAYEYLPATTTSFLTADQLAAAIADAGLNVTSLRRLMFGTQSLIVASPKREN